MTVKITDLLVTPDDGWDALYRGVLAREQEYLLEKEARFVDYRKNNTSLRDIMRVEHFAGRFRPVEPPGYKQWKEENGFGEESKR